MYEDTIKNNLIQKLPVPSEALKVDYFYFKDNFNLIF